MTKNEPGKWTTEFWLTVVGELVTISGAIAGYIEPQLAAVITAVLTGVYATLRTLRKNSADKLAAKKLKSEK